MLTASPQQAQCILETQPLQPLSQAGQTEDAPQSDLVEDEEDG